MGISIYRFFKKASPLALLLFFNKCSEVVVLDPKGPIGNEERFLIYLTVALMLIVIIPVYIMTFWFVKKYRESNTSADYSPKWVSSHKIEWLIWLIPVFIVIVISYFNVKKTAQLDPYKPIESTSAQIQIEVVSLDWGWLFIYPDYKIAVVNQLVFPVKTPLSFKLTSASVMTSFFIPQLGSQMYAMAGMRTKLNLMANDIGIFNGHNQEFSGIGYKNMHFKALATTKEQFEKWLQKVKLSSDTLSLARYEELSKPSLSHPIMYFSSVKTNLFYDILKKYTGWMGDNKFLNMKNMQDTIPANSIINTKLSNTENNNNEMIERK
jgi:cytochrome o ubiquinol oxidase subunit 2